MEDSFGSEESTDKDEAGVSALPSPPPMEKITDANAEEEATSEQEEQSADVVSLDAFRKK